MLCTRGIPYRDVSNINQHSQDDAVRVEAHERLGCERVGPGVLDVAEGGELITHVFTDGSLADGKTPELARGGAAAVVVNKAGLVVASVSTFLPVGAPTTSAFTERLAVLLADSTAPSSTRWSPTVLVHVPSAARPGRTCWRLPKSTLECGNHLK